MPKFRKKPVVIEARQVKYYYDDATKEYDLGNIHEISNWINDIDPRFNPHVEFDPSGEVVFVIATLEGNHYAASGDWIIRGVQDEFYPCKPDIFEQTYDPIVVPNEYDEDFDYRLGDF